MVVASNGVSLGAGREPGNKLGARFEYVVGETGRPALGAQPGLQLCGRTIEFLDAGAGEIGNLDRKSVV